MFRLLLGAAAGYLAADYMAQQSAIKRKHAKLGGVFRNTGQTLSAPKYQTRYLAR